MRVVDDGRQVSAKVWPLCFECGREPAQWMVTFKRGDMPVAVCDFHDLEYQQDPGWHASVSVDWMRRNTPENYVRHLHAVPEQCLPFDDCWPN